MRRSTVLWLPFQLVFPGQAVDETTDVQSRLNCLACLVCLHLAHWQEFEIDKKKFSKNKKKLILMNFLRHRSLPGLNCETFCGRNGLP
jgi:hypothetical protein